MRCVTLVIALGLIGVPSAGMSKNKAEPAKPIGNPGDWFPQNSYPADAKRKGEQGRVSVRLMLDNTGTPVACEVMGSSGSAALDAVTCELAMANARFRPATDARGEAIAAPYTLPGVRWELGGNPPIKLDGPWRASATLRIDQAGKLSSCNEQRSGPVPAEVRLCESAKLMPPAFGMFARGGSAAAVSELLLETSLSFDDAPGLDMAYESGGRETIKMSAIHFEVGIDGKAGNCQVEAQSGPNPENLCESTPGPFFPIEKPRGITVKFAMSRPAAG